MPPLDERHHKTEVVDEDTGEVFTISEPSTGRSVDDPSSPHPTTPAADRALPQRRDTLRSLHKLNPFSKKGGYHYGADDVEAEKQKRDEATSVWTRPALLFIGSIAAFVLVNVSLLAAAMRLQAEAAPGLDADGSGRVVPISKSALYPAYLLQAESIVCELILLGAAIFAVMTQNLISVLAVLIFNVYLVVSGFLEAGQRGLVLTLNQNGPKLQSVSTILWIIPSIDICLHFGSDYAAYKLYRELGWKAYKQSSADLALGKLHRRILVLRALAFFTSVFVLISLWTTMVLGLDWLSFITQRPVPSLVPGALEVFIPLIFEVVFFAAAMVCLYLGVKRETKVLGWGSVGCQVVALALRLTVVGTFTPLLRLVVVQIAKQLKGVSLAKAGALSDEWRCYFQYAVTTVLLLGTLGMSGVVVTGFGKGLKEREIQMSTQPTEQRQVIFD